MWRIYQVAELAGAGYRQRTKQNVIDSGGTLVICFGAPTGGTRETVRFCDRYKKPVLVVDAAAIDPRQLPRLQPSSSRRIRSQC